MLRLRQIALVAHELDPVVTELRAELGVEVAFNDPGVDVFGLQNAVMPIGNQFLEVVAPIKEGTAAGRYLDRRKGDGGYMVILQCDEHAARKARLADELGVRFAMAHDTDDYKILQLHPADTGGSFLEVDQQTGGEDIENGPWEPAGPNWQHARRTEQGRRDHGGRHPERRPGAAGRTLGRDPRGGDRGRVRAGDHPGQRHPAVRRRPPTAAAKGLAGLYLAPGERLAAPRELHICGMHLTIEGATPA